MSTTAATTTLGGRTAGRRRKTRHRKEVTTVIKRLLNLLNPGRISALGWQPALKDRTLFDGQLLDQNREDVYVVMHQMGVIR